MYDLFYRMLRPAYGEERVRVCGGDTDSFFLEFRGLDVPGKVLPDLQRQGLLDTHQTTPEITHCILAS